MQELKPTRNEYTNYTVGTAFAALLVWVLGPDVVDLVDIPGEIAVLVGTLSIWAAWKLGLGND